MLTHICHTSSVTCIFIACWIVTSNNYESTVSSISCYFFKFHQKMHWYNMHHTWSRAWFIRNYWHIYIDNIKVFTIIMYCMCTICAMVNVTNWHSVIVSLHVDISSWYVFCIMVLLSTFGSSVFRILLFAILLSSCPSNATG